ncbi:MAG: ATP synthase F1 subunit delta [Pseudanabaena sp.]|jgi:F-type H+-transporting ATPase subunit delta|uniref:ATP synthase F1 subunit delta n=1 Tax=Pseudanabaena mucicola TaxID=71190 RepID=UPI000E8ACEB9|nr:ATP synthase F1 subunit delta [Pseudanabaena mucicola]MCA6503407.1 F0F1 ATP synthase subunit delta [Pseudanabaena sp. M090S1SP2A07QC]MCA6510377.1 F0F1 ATP synthase subunit delta [Pseudanabaena sp. M109S1SP2A07QC]MCA6523961.1 F0F1 ATP synthase subunit delta [Pseudanabaena sp. M051S1SP2A07QC]MCA6572607.1 F0F1 ATP synthase subunit delta [Pseudanabaena sp. M53BS1SP1A06MG]MCA6582674.1 F0F1 ATP synthase subunit delta [Pseudanabaena sp. M34BS1SP1A06MG]MCA6593478.1 F0F1 ATP synthase subunit delta 
MKSNSVSQAVVAPYADALISLAQEQNSLDVIARDVRLIGDTLSDSGELSQLFSNPLVGANIKKGVIESVFGSQVSAFTKSFLLLLVDRKRIAFLNEVVQQFQALLRVIDGVALAEVTSAFQLSRVQEDSLRDRVKKLTGAKAVELSITINPDLIGGVIIKVGSQVVDASIRGQLRRIKSSLAAA